MDFTKYKNPFSYADNPREWRDFEISFIEQFRTDLIAEYAYFLPEKKQELIWRMSWIDNAVGGFKETAEFFQRLVEIAR